MDELKTWKCSCGAVSTFPGEPEPCDNCGEGEWRYLHDGEVTEEDVLDVKEELLAESGDVYRRMNSIPIPSPGLQTDVVSLARAHEQAMAEFERAGAPEGPEFD